MAKISSLWVEIGANSAKFSQELKKTSSQAKGWGASVKATVGKAAGVFALVTAAVAATAAAITGLYTRQSEYIDNLAKQSSKLNTLVADLQAVKSAADFAGVGAGIENAMQRLVRGMGDAAQGTGEALKAVEKLGLNAAAIASKTATEQLQIVLDKLQEIPPGAERVSLAFKFFGREGVGLVNLTSDAIRNSREELDRWGVTVTEQQAAWVESTNDSLSRLSKFMSGASIQFSTKLAPMIGAASEGLLQMAQNTINWGEITDKVVSMIKRLYLGVKVSVDTVILSFKTLRVSAQMTLRFLAKELSELDRLLARTLSALPGIEYKAATNAGEWAESLTVSINQGLKEIEQLGVKVGAAWKDGVQGGDYASYGRELDKLLEGQKGRAEEARRVGIDLQSSLRMGMSGAANDPVSSSVVVPFKSNNMADAIRERNLKAAREQREAARAAAEAQRAQMKEMADQVRAVNGEIETFANRLGQGITESAERGSAAVREMVADMLIQLAKVKLQQAFAGSATPGGASSTFLGGLIGGLFSNQAVPTGAGAASTSLNAGASAAGYAPSVINNIQVSATGEASGAVSSLRAGVRQLTEASPQQVATRAMRGGSYAQSFGR